MLEKLLQHLRLHFPFLSEKKLLLATSGGLDSMVMLHLFQQLPFEIAVAHCNFQLRGLESFDDEKFLVDYCKSNAIKCYTTQFDTKNFAVDYKLSTQVAARELRYNWFYELVANEKYDYILTAHHADDALETTLINMIRGTGLDGLTGIPAQNELVIRPLLPFSRDEILEYAQENKIMWREDSSNASDYYLRNKIRYNLVPIFKELNPDFLYSFQKTQTYLQESKSMVDDAANFMYAFVANEIGEEVHFDCLKIKEIPNYKSYLYQWLKDYGFSDWDAIYDLVEAVSGKQIFSKNYRLLKNREDLILSPIMETDLDEAYYIDQNQQTIDFPIKLTIGNKSFLSDNENSVIFVDADKLQFPLVLKKWKEGAVFQPLGMNGQSKKVSKIFKDEKLSLLEKENCWLLYSDNQIVWVIGIRQDERFKIDDTTQNSIQIALLK